MSTDRGERVSRKEETRALFIFGLLAVFASIRVQYSQLLVKLPYGTINLVPIIDNIIILWSFYAFFMIIGLSSDIVGKTTARIFGDVSNVFLQWSFIILGVLMIPFGLLAYGLRLILLFALILIAIVLAVIYVLSTKTLSLRKLFSSFRNREGALTKKQQSMFVLGLILLSSLYGMLNYPQEWFASPEVVILAFIIGAIVISILILIQEPKDDDTYDSTYSAYY